MLPSHLKVSVPDMDEEKGEVYGPFFATFAPFSGNFLAFLGELFSSERGERGKGCLS